MRATELAHLLMRQSLKAGDRVVDATVGNGHDTGVLAELVGPAGQVFGFDVQEAALGEAARRLEGLPQVRLIHAGHETLAEHLGALDGEGGDKRLAAVMFNLGYLPGGSKAIMTAAETTLAALEQALALLGAQGLVTLVLYPGHAGGMQEAAAVRDYARGLGDAYAVTHTARLHTRAPAPELLVIERVGECR